MSLSQYPVPTLLVDDPRIATYVDPVFTVERSAGDITYMKQNANSNSGGNILLTAKVPSRDTIISSKMYVKNQFDVTLTADAAIFPAANASKAAYLVTYPISVRFSPLISASTNIQIQLDGKILNEPLNRYFAALMRYRNTAEELMTDLSQFPSSLDFYQSLNQKTNQDSTAFTVPGTTTNASTYSKSSNILFPSQTPYEPSSRSVWLAQEMQFNVANSTDMIFKFTFECCEVLPLSPFVFGSGETKGLCGLDTIQFNINYNESKLNSIIELPILRTAAGALINVTSSVKLVDNKTVFEYIQLKPRPNMLLPPIFRYKYNEIQHVPKNISISNYLPYNIYTGYDQGATSLQKFTSVSSDVLTLTGIPKFLYIYVKRQDSAITPTTLDTYQRITRVNITLGARSGLLGEASEYALYRMSVKNGLIDSWDDWTSGCGSVVCIDLGQDLGLNMLEAPGTLSGKTLQVEIDFQNLYFDFTFPYSPANPIVTYNTMELNTILVSEGMLISGGGQVLLETNVLSALDTINKKQVQDVDRSKMLDYYGGSYSGGAFRKYIDYAKKGFAKGKEIYEKAEPIVKKAVEVGKVAAPLLASLVAAGYEEDQIYSVLAKLDKPKKKKKMLAIEDAKGGKMASKKALAKYAL